jgi:hypothetical protein
MCGLSGWFAAFFFFSFLFCFCLSFAARGALKGSHFARTAPAECFVVVPPHVQKIWKEREEKKYPEIKSPTDAAHFFSVCFAIRTAYVTLWNIMLQMPINRIQKNCKEESW